MRAQIYADPRVHVRMVNRKNINPHTHGEENKY